MTLKVCENQNCKNEFESSVRHPEKIYCSRGCKERVSERKREQRQRDERRASRVYAHIKKTCPGCDKQFETGILDKRYCTERCGKNSRERQRRKRLWAKLNLFADLKESFLARARERSRRHYENHKEREQERARERTRQKHGIRAACSTCGHPVNKGSEICYKCKPQYKPRQKQSIICKGCSIEFIGYKRDKYCPSCRTAPRLSLLEAVRCALNRQRAKLLGLPADFKPSDWRRAKQHFNNHCAYCGGSGDMQQDHFIPLALGGGTTRNNIVPACPGCNGSKSDTHPAIWLPAYKYQQISAFLGA